ncbi:MAG TPA: M42 family peptidase [Solirubrobacterales bacterium]|nr:M42 family peptidase [Solirubrobacterales bacterium]
MDPKPIPPLFDELLRTPGPSGHEDPAAAVWRRAAAEFAEVSSDGVGSSIARVGEASPLLGVFGHIDEIGLIVTHIEEQGLLWVAPIGFWDPQILVGQRIEIRGKEGPVLGVIGRRNTIGLINGGENFKRAVDFDDLHVDIGAADRDEAAALVGAGDTAVVAVEPIQVAGGRIASRALDNRVGAYVALEALRRCRERGGPGGSFAAVATVQEELGLLGARTSAFALRPDVAIAVDGVRATDLPGENSRAMGVREVGRGVVIGRGPTLSAKVSQFLIETAEAEGIQHRVAGYGLTHVGLSSGTDADALQVSRSGIPTGVVSVPLRYVHSPVEVADMGDIEAAIELLAAAGARLSAEVDFSR